MHKRWDKRQSQHGFTLVELLIVVLVIAIVAAIAVSTFTNVTRRAAITTTQDTLKSAYKAMEQAKTTAGAYPTTRPSSLQVSDSVQLDLRYAHHHPVYRDGLSPVQNGSLFANICQELIDSGAGIGVDTGGTSRPYITGCGNWNDDSTQITGWTSRVWQTPVTEAQLLEYAENYTVSNATHKQAQETVYKNFYRSLVSRLKAQGGSFPITSFWDYWATPGNGGVAQQPLPGNPSTEGIFCYEARPTSQPQNFWHITQEGRVTEGRCA